MIKRIHVRYELRVDEAPDQAVLDRVLGFYADRCPVARSIGGCIAITDELVVVGA